MTTYFCPFCGLNHGPDSRPNRRPCPKVRALKFDDDGTVLAFKLIGVKGWQHKSKLMRRESAPFPYAPTIPVPVHMEMDL